jgi:hypothetical protein
MRRWSKSLGTMRARAHSAGRCESASRRPRNRERCAPKSRAPAGFQRPFCRRAAPGSDISRGYDPAEPPPPNAPRWLRPRAASPRSATPARRSRPGRPKQTPGHSRQRLPPRLRCASLALSHCRGAIPVGVERLVLFRGWPSGASRKARLEKVKWNPYRDGPTERERSSTLRVGRRARRPLRPGRASCDG